MIRIPMVVLRIHALTWTESQNQGVTLHPCFFALGLSSSLEDFSDVSLELRPLVLALSFVPLKGSR